MADLLTDQELADLRAVDAADLESGRDGRSALSQGEARALLDMVAALRADRDAARETLQTAEENSRAWLRQLDRAEADRDTCAAALRAFFAEWDSDHPHADCAPSDVTEALMRDALAGLSHGESA